MTQHRTAPDRRTYLGKGKLEEPSGRTATEGAEVLLVDDELSPVQQRRSRTR